MDARTAARHILKNDETRCRSCRRSLIGSAVFERVEVWGGSKAVIVTCRRCKHRFALVTHILGKVDSRVLKKG